MSLPKRFAVDSTVEVTTSKERKGVSAMRMALETVLDAVSQTAKECDDVKTLRMLSACLQKAVLLIEARIKMLNATRCPN